MKKNIFIGLAFIIALSCSNEDEANGVKQEYGSMWLSGGLATCATQIHLDNGVALIVEFNEIGDLKSGDRVKVKYKAKGIKESCPPGIECEVIEIKKAN